jgi:hypothetical protein
MRERSSVNENEKGVFGCSKTCTGSRSHLWLFIRLGRDAKAKAKEIVTVQALVPDPWHVDVYVQCEPNGGNTEPQSH